MPETERPAALEALRRKHPEMAAEVETLLAVEAPVALWFERLERNLGRGRTAELDAAWAPGRIVGPYRLERLLATGGMDAVLVARKADGELQRPVALKLSPPGLIGNESITRLRRERDLLTGLSHPHIAALLDAGVTAEGQPRFALELIDGLPLIAWCDKRWGDRRLHFHGSYDTTAATTAAAP